ncbi:uncharacterized protein MELLADRAFT_40100 [Melampsora larici-populina 98AG31]|uniref:Mitochondrial distribution and morphology protein 35 n=1 Tax=Melampsora larici-populina (strain 98AG31 / pathotype 3-4-7) TaxID=747676 RepID=F4S6B1_MELLP|nr:uncharacterized protein MELLADRAFT_40100 [Melampsora larici-populina 98AG31]EGF99830.1 hypothetical protein MELLADRAFT_40100 [Melampsora larici-populina 98AG31]
MDSLEPECTPLKKSYDGCFNRWFERYLQLSNQYEIECGQQWTAYQTCLNKAIESRQLKPLLDAARQEDPLKSYNDIETSTGR